MSAVILGPVMKLICEASKIWVFNISKADSKSLTILFALTKAICTFGIAETKRFHIEYEYSTKVPLSAMANSTSEMPISALFATFLSPEKFMLIEFLPNPAKCLLQAQSRKQ